MDHGETIRMERERLGWSQIRLAKEAKAPQQAISRIEQGGNSKYVPQILKVLDEARGQPVVEKTATIPDAVPHGPPTMPVYASARGGPGEMIVSLDPIDHVPRPAPLLAVKNGYGMYVVGDSMVPRFEQGDMLLVNPHVPFRSGDDVVIYQDLDGEFAAIVKRLVRANDSIWVLQQYNPSKIFELDRAEWPHCNVIVGLYNRRY